jgi:hypothetical protein
MRLSAAFNTWRDTTLAARQRVGLANSAASRIRNAMLASAFNGWRYNVVRRKQLAAAAEAVLRQWRYSRLSAAFRWAQLSVCSGASITFQCCTVSRELGCLSTAAGSLC